MILVTKAPCGLTLQRDDRADPPLFVANNEVAAAIADMIARTTDASDLDAWDTWAVLCGNDEAAALA